MFVDIQLAQETGLVGQTNEKIFHKVLDNLQKEAFSINNTENLGNPGTLIAFRSRICRPITLHCLEISYLEI